MQHPEDILQQKRIQEQSAQLQQQALQLQQQLQQQQQRQASEVSESTPSPSTSKTTTKTPNTNTDVDTKTTAAPAATNKTSTTGDNNKSSPKIYQQPLKDSSRKMIAATGNTTRPSSTTGGGEGGTGGGSTTDPAATAAAAAAAAVTPISMSMVSTTSMSVFGDTSAGANTNNGLFRKGKNSTSNNKGPATREARYQKIAKQRILVLRLVMLVCLLTTVAVCASVAYMRLSETEKQVGLNTYESIALSALKNAQSTTTRKLQGSQVMSTLLSHIYPNLEDWPMNIKFNGYIPVASKVADLSSSGTQAFMVLLNDPINQLAEFESLAKQVYAEQNRPNTTGYSEFGFGVWKPDTINDPSLYEDGRLHDTTGIPDWENAQNPNIMLPLYMHNVPGSSSILYNVYSQEDRGIHVDSMLNCVNEYKENTTNVESGMSPICPVVTDMLELKIKPGPAGLLFQPIFPANSPTEFVGFATTSLHWQDVLENVVPDYVNGLTCVISTSTGKSFTYEIRDGYPELVGEDDQHDDKYTDMALDVILNEDIITGSSSSAIYTLTVYPTEEMLTTFSTNSPLSVALGFMGAICACTIIFVLYDILMRRQAQQNNMILEMKRKFVRFISHEIRTPLNTVCMGLELLESELKDIQEQIGSGSGNGNGGNAGCNTGGGDVETGGVGGVPGRVQGQEESKNNKNQDSSVTSSNPDRVSAAADAAAAFASSASDDGNSSDDSSPAALTSREDIDFWYSVTTDVKENAHVAVSILNDLLNFDKIETGTLKLELAKVNIWDLVESTVNQFRIQAVNRKIDLKLDIDKPDPVVVSSCLVSNKDGKMNKLNDDLEVDMDASNNGVVNINPDLTTIRETEASMTGTEIEDVLDLYNMVGDDVRLGQVLRNVISNALKFTPEDGTVQISAMHIPDGLPNSKPLFMDCEGEDGEYQAPACVHPRAGSIAIIVKDSGVGLSKEQLSRLFGEGVQFDANRLQHGGGSGLGLSIAKGIVEQHHGTIRAESDGHGYGTTFIIELPLHEYPIEELVQEQHEDDQKRASEDGVTATTTDTTNNDGDDALNVSSRRAVHPPPKKRVLVAEDAASSRKMLIRLLERAGHTCVPACNGKEAVAAIKNDMKMTIENPDDHVPIDLCLMDFEMPLLNGPEATELIRKIGFTGMIIGVTGNVLEEDVEFFKKHGANDVLPKPISLQSLTHAWGKVDVNKKKRRPSVSDSIRSIRSVRSGNQMN